MIGNHVGEGAKATWKPGPKLPGPADISRTYDHGVVVERAARLAQTDPQRYASVVNKLPPRSLASVRRVLGLKGGGKLDRRAAKALLGRLASRSSRSRVLDVVCQGDKVFAHPLTDGQWLSLLKLEPAGLRDVTERGSTALLWIHAAVSLPAGEPSVLLELADGVRRGRSGAAVALALLAGADERAATAYSEIAKDFPALPPSPPTRAQLGSLVAEVLGITGADGQVSDTGERREPEWGGEASRAAGDLEAGPGPRAVAHAASRPPSLEPAPATPPVKATWSYAETANASSGTVTAGELEVIVDDGWEESRRVAAELASSLERGVVPASSTGATIELGQFVARVTEVAVALDVTTRGDLRAALTELRRREVVPERRWLLRLAEMQGPADLAASLGAVAALAEHAATLPAHVSDDALLALLTSIDLAAELSAGEPVDWQAANQAQLTAQAGLPEHGGLVFAAGVGRLTLPPPDESAFDPSSLHATADAADDDASDEASPLGPPDTADRGEPARSVSDPAADGKPIGSAESRPVIDEAGRRDEQSSDGPSDEPLPDGPSDEPLPDGPDDQELPDGPEAEQPSAPAAESPDGSDEPGPGEHPLPQLASQEMQSAAGSAVEPTVPSRPVAAPAQETSTSGPGEQRPRGEASPDSLMDGSPCDPWEEGDPPRIAALIASHREGLAYYLARAAGMSEARVRALSFFVGANRCRPDRLVGELGPVWPDSEQVARLNANECRILLAAETRIALTLGYDPTGQLESFLSSVTLEDYPAAEQLSTIVRMAAHGFQRPAKAAASGSSVDQWRAVLATAEEVRSSLVNSKISFQRASKIIHHLARDNEPIGSHLLRLREIAEAYSSGTTPSSGLWEDFCTFAQSLQDLGTQTRLLDAADRVVSIPAQVRKPVIANARTRMYAFLASVADVSADAIALRSRMDSAAAGTRSGGDGSKFLAARDALVPVTVKSAGDAALQVLVDWLRDEEPAPTTGVALAAVLERDIDPLYELPRDEAGRPTRDPSVAEIEALTVGRDDLAVVRGYLEAGNLRAAQDFIQRARVPRTDELADELRESDHDLKRRHRSAFVEASRLVSRVRALNRDLEENDSALSFAGRLTALETIETDERVDLTLRALQEVQDDAGAVLAEVRDELRRRALDVEDEDDRLRICGLIESGEEPLAVEYLTLCEAGTALPSLEPVSAEDFARFFPEVVGVCDEARRARRDPVAAVCEQLGLSGEPEQQRLRLGLAGWRVVAQEKQGTKTFRENVAAVVRMLGLNPEPSDWLNPINRTKNAGYASFALRARPADGSYVPLFGTKAGGRYDLTLVWEEVRNPRVLLQKIDVDRQSEPNIILYFGTLSVEQRIQLRKLTHSGEFSPLVIDEAVIGWLCTREEPGWKLTQRVTLPFTTVNPYVSVGDVPDEVFVGRERERRAIIDPTGSMFVYGGRQLGKSALLRRVERGLNRESDRTTVVYLDLKTANLGEAAPASELWPELATRLEKVGVLEGRRAKWSADEVIHGIERWLGSDDSRRLLLLLDEADNFLTYDANDTGRTGLGGFPVLQRLKGLMENSQGRFKPVFAGLHQVQRFHNMPNTPVAHGGDDILIGPLSFGDAQRLVADPLRALGFRFESPETVWRLLLLTNYQASLIQIVCEALVDHMRPTSLPRAGGGIVITSEHVEDVYAKRAVRDRIRDRFRWTIGLDNRYRVVALVTALMAFDAAPGEGFSPADLQDTCASFWSAGFERTTLSTSEFRRYLEEMRGLGVLHRLDNGDYVLRSPNIRSLLGTKQQIEDELIEASETLEVEYRYNPTMNRRILERLGEGDGGEVRSPLPDADLVKLLDQADPIQFVVGTRALGLGRVAKALKKVASESKRKVVEVQPDRLRGHVRADLDRHLIVDLTRHDLGKETVEAAIHRLATAQGVYATVLLRAAGPFDVTTVIERFPYVSLNRWTADGLGAWQDSHFPTPTLRKRLKRWTGGWPEKVELAMRLVAASRSPDEALEEVAATVRTPDDARSFLAAAGVPVDDVVTWVRWFGQTGKDGLIEVPALTLDWLDDTGEMSAPAEELVSRLQLADAVDETSEGFVLDRLVVEAAHQLVP